MINAIKKNNARKVCIDWRMIREGPPGEDMNKKGERGKKRTIERSFLLKGNSKSKGPEAGKYSACLHIWKARRWMVRSKEGLSSRKWRQRYPWRPNLWGFVGHGKDFGFLTECDRMILMKGFWAWPWLNLIYVFKNGTLAAGGNYCVQASM